MNKLKENLQTQLSELETLQSMFYNPGEIRIEDLSVLKDIQLFLEGKSDIIPSQIDLSINLHIENLKFELCIGLSSEYPNCEPEIFVRNHKLTKSQHKNLNKDLNEFILGLSRGEACIFSGISWLQDNASHYLEKEEKLEDKPVKNEKLTRFWIYSHHIYSKTKRREIVDSAIHLNCTGFCMPGKPGIICIEGTLTDCNEWWQTIKSMNWKRIFCKITEECSEGEQENFLKFQKFEEIVFQNNNVKCNHMDMGELYKFLEEHTCGYVFKEIFGVEVKTS